MNFDERYFIDKFLKIPEFEWLDGDLCETDYDGNFKEGSHCALGHLGVRSYSKSDCTEEVKSLGAILKENIPFLGKAVDNYMSRNPEKGETEQYFMPVYTMNDSSSNSDKYGDSPRQRMVCSLLEILKKKENEEQV